MQKSKIIYTITDEAPALATQSLIPILKSFTHQSGIEFELQDISLSARILSIFPENLKDDQKTPNALQNLSDLVLLPQVNIIKLPNISASVPQLLGAIKELQAAGFNIPDYPTTPKTKNEDDIKTRYDK